MMTLHYQYFFSQRYAFIACHIMSWLFTYLMMTFIVMQNPYASWIETVYGAIFIFSGALVTYLIRCLYKKHIQHRSNLFQFMFLCVGSCLTTLFATTILLLGVFFIAHIGISRPIPASQLGFVIETVGLSNGINMLGLAMLWSLGYLALSKIKSLSEAHSLLTVSQLQALNSQLNPHFLFNAINDIRALILAQPTQARESLAELADMLRYSLQTNQDDKVALGEELENAQHYLNLCKIGLAERLQTDIDVAAEAVTLKVPKMVLQLCLENAIKHGIAKNRAGGLVSLKVRCDEKLFIEVMNPLIENAKPSGGLGLATKNIEKRLALLYKGEGSIKRVVREQRVVTCIELPKEAL
ncbi:histidine kinase [Pseudoalteromonas sp. MMG013]|uniref:sensor histidine kinase n=1 Tax=Pseudoalteromonas sp. MMG013 TaxID=2822687 RepID=UPI001B388F77|nr:histidine kinase [Pseudoalteromonas sp. MMG013]MBQ4862137.1 histidine kinase [Pseudoalteromonas sp. MMG013]